MIIKAIKINNVSRMSVQASNVPDVGTGQQEIETGYQISGQDCTSLGGGGTESRG